MVTNQDENDPWRDDLIWKLAVGTLFAASAAEITAQFASFMRKHQGSTEKDGGG
jgi:hypothetical protein